MVEKAKAIDHTTNTSLLERDEVVNHFNDKKICVNLSMDESIKVMKETKNCVFMFSRCVHNINDIFDDIIIKFKTVLEITKCNKPISWNFVIF